MLLEIYINDRLWKSEPLESHNYQPVKYWLEIYEQKAAGQLDSFGIDQGMKVEFVPKYDS